MPPDVCTISQDLFFGCETPIPKNVERKHNYSDEGEVPEVEGLLLDLSGLGGAGQKMPVSHNTHRCITYDGRTLKIRHFILSQGKER